MKIHRATPQEALSGLGASRGGLSGVEALRRKAEFGENKIPRVEGEAAWRMLTRQFTHFLALLLWLGAALAFAAEALSPGEGMLSLGFAILGVIAVNGLFSFWQEYRAEKALKALEKLLPQRAAALRDGAVSLIEASEVVPGDILVVGEGDSVPADCRIIEAEGLL
ncbi:cation-transporting P-type ATPase, partial [bacterium]